MVLIVGSVILGLLNVLGMYLMRYRWRWGCYLGIGIQVPWTVYDILTRQYGFLLITIVAVPVYVRMLRKGL